MNIVFREYEKHNNIEFITTSVVASQAIDIKSLIIDKVEFPGITNFQAQMSEYCEQVGLKINSYTRKRPLIEFEKKERPALNAVPHYPLYDHGTPLFYSNCKVHDDHHIVIARRYFSVPTRYLGKTVTAIDDNLCIRIYFLGKLIKTHVKSPLSKYSTDYEDFPKVQTIDNMRICTYYINAGKRLGDSVGRYMEALFDRKYPWIKIREAQLLIRCAMNSCRESVDALFGEELRNDRPNSYLLARTLSKK